MATSKTTRKTAKIQFHGDRVVAVALGERIELLVIFKPTKVLFPDRESYYDVELKDATKVRWESEGPRRVLTVETLDGVTLVHLMR